MMTPARKHFQRVTAAKAAGDVAQGEPQTGDQYELMAAALWEARRSLKGIKSIEAKVAKKRELLPDFDAYVDGVIEGGSGAQDDVLMTVMLWRFDIGDLAGGLLIADYALKHNLEAPDRFERDTASLVAEQVAEESLKLLDSENADAATFVDLLGYASEITAAADMHDQIRAKLHKALGYAHRANGTTAEAIENLKRALELNDRVGVKKDIERLERELKQQGEGDKAEAEQSEAAEQIGEGEGDKPEAEQPESTQQNEGDQPKKG